MYRYCIGELLVFSCTQPGILLLLLLFFVAGEGNFSVLCVSLPFLSNKRLSDMLLQLQWRGAFCVNSPTILSGCWCDIRVQACTCVCEFISCSEISLVAQVSVGVLPVLVCFEIEFRGIKKVGSARLNVNIELKPKGVFGKKARYTALCEKNHCL